MKTLTTAIKNAKSKVMRTAWHLFRTTGGSFSESLRQAWQIIKNAFAKIETEKGMCFRENGKNVYRRIAREGKEINREMVANIVFLVDHLKRCVEADKIKAQTESYHSEIRAKYSPIIADRLIYQSSLD